LSLGNRFFSNNTVFNPYSAHLLAAALPAGPAPITATSIILSRSPGY
jgi:hypothetical protein